MRLSKSNLTYTVLITGLALLYYAAARIGLLISFEPESITPMWPPAGISLAAVLLFGVRMWPGIVLGELVLSLHTHPHWISLIGFLLAATLRPIVALHLLERWVGFRPALDRLKDVLGLTAVAAVGSGAMSATIAVSAIALSGAIPWANYGSVWVLFWLGDVLGVLIVAPPILTWSTVRPRRWRWAQIAEAVVLVASLVVVAQVAFGNWLSPQHRPEALEFAVFPLLIWAALRYDSPGAAGATFLLAGLAIVGTVSGFGPFVGGSLKQNLMLLQSFMGVVTVTALALAANTAERRSAQFRLEDSRERLRHLSLRLQSIGEEERKRIAGEIHDQLGQALTVLKVDLSLLGQRWPQNHELRARIGSMSDLIDSNIDTVRRLSSELRPGLLDDLGLAAAVEWQAEEFERHTGIRCEVEIKPRRMMIDAARSTACFRIFQEALTNVARHANASHLWIRLHQVDDHVRLQVRDDGRGISSEKLSDPKASGLVGMRERVLPWHGEVFVSGAPNQGTEVTVVIPLDPAQRPTRGEWIGAPSE